MTATDLTAKQAKVLIWIIAYNRQHDGWPTIREIMTAFNMRSPNGVMAHLDALVKKGYISMSDMKARSIRVLKGPDGKAVEGITTEAVEKAIAELFTYPDGETADYVRPWPESKTLSIGEQLIPVSVIKDELCKALGLPMPERNGR